MLIVIRAAVIISKPVAFASLQSCRMVPMFLWLLAHVFSLVEGNCRNLRFTTTRQNQRLLPNHTIETIHPITDIKRCTSICYLEPTCFGVNFCVDQESTATCELTNSDHIRSEADLVDKPGCTFYGSETACSSEPCPNNATCEGDFDYAPVPYKCICPAGYSGQDCEKDIDECTAADMNDCHEDATCTNYQGGYECQCKAGFHGNGKDCKVCNGNFSLGMEDGNIPDNSITASSKWDGFHSASRARLNIERVGQYRGAWSAKVNNVLQWLQVDLSSITVVKGIATQGRSDLSQWVKSYSLNYSLNGLHFDDYEGGKIFRGNNDRNTIVKHDLLPYIIARYIRVRPKDWYEHVSMRMELYGCR